jgi:hypothetical protein
MRYLVVGVLMAAGLAGLVIDAAADDPYYGDGTSHWDHAGRLGTQPLVVVGAIVAAVVTLWVFTRALPRSRPPSALVASFAVLVYLFSWAVAWMFMGIGH